MDSGGWSGDLAAVLGGGWASFGCFCPHVAPFLPEAGVMNSVDDGGGGGVVWW